MERFGVNVFKDNFGICGKLMGLECKGIVDFMNGEVCEENGFKKFNIKIIVMVILVVVAVMVILFVLLIMVKLKNNDKDDFSVFGKESVDDVVEVRVYGGGSRYSNVSGRGGGGGGSFRKSGDFFSYKKGSE